MNDAILFYIIKGIQGRINQYEIVFCFIYSPCNIKYKTNTDLYLPKNGVNRISFDCLLNNPVPITNEEWHTSTTPKTNQIINSSLIFIPNLRIKQEDSNTIIRPQATHGADIHQFLAHFVFKYERIRWTEFREMSEGIKHGLFVKFSGSLIGNNG